MKKVILLVILVILVVLLIWWNTVRARRVREERNFTANSQKSGAKADLILSDAGDILSYSILIKQNVKAVKSVHFTAEGQRVKQISGPQVIDKDDLILHGLWRRKDATPLTAALAELVKNGELGIEVEFAGTEKIELSK